MQPGDHAASLLPKPLLFRYPTQRFALNENSKFLYLLDFSRCLLCTRGHVPIPVNFSSTRDAALVSAFQLFISITGFNVYVCPFPDLCPSIILVPVRREPMRSRVKILGLGASSPKSASIASNCFRPVPDKLSKT